MRTFSLILFAFLGLLQLQAQTVSVTPAVFSESDEITITVSDFDPMTEWGVNDLYLWAWYNPDGGGGDAPGNGSWGDSGESAKFTPQGDGTYTFTMVPTTYYGTTGIEKIGFLVKSKDGNNQTQDYVYDVGGYQMALTQPTEQTTVVSAGTNLQIEATASASSNWTLFAAGTPVHTLNDTEDYNYSYQVNSTTNFKLQAVSGTETRSEEFTAAIAPTVTEAPVPAGMKDGINLHASDDTKATLVFYAPGKSFVHVIGDFNNWQIDDNYLMNYDPATDRFWLELNGLDPQADHLYQYLVEFSINVADPYSTLILDGYGNDAYIEAETYPDLPAYPSGQSHAVTVLQTGEAPYNWQVNDFMKPKKEDLVIYELLIRDFDARHSFDAVRDRLDYLQDLGINAIELMPVNEFDGNESWGYNPSFHMALDKYYGTKEALKQLVDEAHARGMAVIIDVVYNHATGQHPYYRMWNTDNGGTGGQASASNPFFNPSATHAYSVFNDFNHQSEATRDYVKQTAQYWIEEFKIDGMRWDLTKGFTQNCDSGDQNCTNALQQDRIDVLKEYADAQWAVDPDFYVIFEHLGGIDEEEEWADYREDEGKGILLWNKQTGPYNEATMGHHDGGKSNFSGVSWKDKGFKQPSAISYMESHDEERLMYKNLMYGNNEGYDASTLNDALERMETAGAFFFTVPGPKMIWQFGELGYEVSIEENGRTGNKPIRWEYFSDPDRKAIYETWSDLIKLKIGEPIFETSNFDLDLGSTSGLKRIHLQLPSAATGEIQYVTILGNFGVEPQEINPGFQETGVWYEFLNGNKKFIVTDSQESITLEPGEFRIFGDEPSSLFPNENLPDDDSDGVSNTYDECPDTPLGATVNTSGCVVFSLPADNFSIRTLAETCRSSDNGKIIIESKEAHEYVATLNGDQASSTFSSTYTFDGLSAGTYRLCITVTGEEYEQCFNLDINEPEELSVSAKVDPDGKHISLELKGGQRYRIQLGKKEYYTSASQITLPLPGGATDLRVSTEKTCQGVYDDLILVHTARLYPNPVMEDQLSIHLSHIASTGTHVQLFDLNGKLHTRHLVPAGSRTMRMDTSGLPQGVYLVRITQGEISSTHKIMKP